MTASFDERLRYGSYAIAAVLALIAYFWLDAEPDRPTQAVARNFLENEGLPQLRLLENGTRREARRDLFAFVNHAQTELQATPIFPAPEAVTSEASPRTPDLLSNLQVMGLVRQTDSVTILVRVGTALITVGLGEQFGAGDALSVQSVEGRRVIIFDNASRTSRTFVLSEE